MANSFAGSREGGLYLGQVVCNRVGDAGCSRGTHGVVTGLGRLLLSQCAVYGCELALEPFDLQANKPSLRTLFSVCFRTSLQMCGASLLVIYIP